MTVRHILLVDDDFDDAELFGEALAEVDGGIQFTHYDDGRDAVKALRNKSIEPDLVFLDINIPSFSGWQCLTEIRNMEQTKDLPAIMYTTSTVQREKEIAKDLGASGFVTKPQSYKELKVILENILTNRLDDVQQMNLF